MQWHLKLCSGKRIKGKKKKAGGEFNLNIYPHRYLIALEVQILYGSVVILGEKFELNSWKKKKQKQKTSQMKVISKKGEKM